MSSVESWNYTPREFDARLRVYNSFKEAEHKRWCIDRAERLNGPLVRKDRRLWSEADFMGGAIADTPKKLDPEQELIEYVRRRAGIADKPVSEAQDLIDYNRALSRDKSLSQQMQTKDFDDSQLPAWARMTPEEKRSRGR